MIRDVTEGASQFKTIFASYLRIAFKMEKHLKIRFCFLLLAAKRVVERYGEHPGGPDK